MEKFTRTETSILTRTSPQRLAYLAKTGVVVPDLIEGQQQLCYSWEQILELRAIQHLRRQLSLQTIRKILDFLEGIGGDRTLHNKNLVIANGEVDWVQTTADDVTPQAVCVATKTNCHVGQLNLLVLPHIADLSNEIWSIARQSNVIDFENFRRRALPSDPAHSFTE